MINNTFTTFINFLREPKDGRNPNQKFFFKLKTFLLLFLLEIVIMLVLMSIIGGLEKMGVLDLSQHEMGSMMEKLPIPIMLLGGVAIIPLIEELIFRFSLTYNRNIPFLISESLSSPEKVQAFWHQNYRLFFYFSTTAFAFAHILNFGTLNSKILLLSPILVAPQFFMGAVTGYLRVKFGFLWGYALHFFHNLLFIGGALLAMNMAIEKTNQSNEDYNIKIEEIAMSNNPLQSIDSITVDSGIDFNIINYKTKDLFAYLLDVNLNKVDIDYKSINKLKYNISFLGKKDSIDIKSTILKEFNDAYHSNVSREMRLSSNWDLVVMDSTLLMKHAISEDSLGYPSATGQPFALKTSLKNYKIHQLAISFNSTFSEKLSTSVKMDSQFNFMDMPTNDFDKTNTRLQQIYGLGFVREEEKVEYIVVREVN